MTSAYGRNNYNLWMNKNKKNNLIIYDLKKGILKKRIDSKWVEYID